MARKQFTPTQLRPWPLTARDRCQRCGITSDAANLLPERRLELDHMHEVALGGIDHPINLIRLCHHCHQAKPFFENMRGWEARLAILEWIRFARETGLAYDTEHDPRSDLRKDTVRSAIFSRRRAERYGDSWILGDELTYPWHRYTPFSQQETEARNRWIADRAAERAA